MQISPLYHPVVKLLTLASLAPSSTGTQVLPVAWCPATQFQEVPLGVGFHGKDMLPCARDPRQRVTGPTQPFLIRACWRPPPEAGQS